MTRHDDGLEYYASALPTKKSIGKLAETYGRWVRVEAEEEPTFVKFQKGDCYIGMYLGPGKDVPTTGSNGPYIGKTALLRGCREDLDEDAIALLSFFVHTDLKKKLEKVGAGSTVRIRYVGMVGQGSWKRHEYEVDVLEEGK